MTLLELLILVLCAIGAVVGAITLVALGFTGFLVVGAMLGLLVGAFQGPLLWGLATGLFSLVLQIVAVLKRHWTGASLGLIALVLHHQASKLNSPIVVLLYWAVFALSLVSASYILGTPWLFGKTANGTLKLFSKLVLFPYVALAWISWHLARVVSSEDPFNQLTETIWIGRRLIASEAAPPVEVVLDLTCEFGEPAGIRHNCARYLSLPILDRSVPANTRTVVTLLLDPEISKARVYVHCAQGHGRSGMIAMLLLLAQDPSQSVAATLSRVQQVRPAVRLTREQLAFVERVVPLLK